VVVRDHLRQVLYDGTHDEGLRQARLVHSHVSVPQVVHICEGALRVHDHGRYLALLWVLEPCLNEGLFRPIAFLVFLEEHQMSIVLLQLYVFHLGGLAGTTAVLLLKPQVNERVTYFHAFLFEFLLHYFVRSMLRVTEVSCGLELPVPLH
jgi:hypothetical protein